MKSLHGLDHLSLILDTINTGVMKLWIEDIYALHPDMKIHTCGKISMGKGEI